MMFADSHDGFAIVGMAGRFPGAVDVTAFWRNLCDGVESITAFDRAELEAGSPDVHARPEFVAARAILNDVDRFDASFFGISPRDAELIDPQHRILLECTLEALEDAGYDPLSYAGAIGVYAGCTINTYVLRNVLPNRERVEQFTGDYQVGSYPELLGAGQDFLATRIAYKLGLRGPAMTVQSACSTSLVAVAQACMALDAGQADMMLAGAVSVSFPQRRGYLHQAGGMVSADGHCRPFDAASSGTVFGDGAGIVVLKRLADALRDRDHIYAVIRGVGVNNDGSSKAGYTAPSASGEAGAIAAAHAMAGFDPRTIRYVECHGTATPLGDPIEFAALAKTFGSAESGPYCALGSVKSNIGHLDVAAGMSGLIKTALAIHHGKIPPTLHFTRPNPRIPFAGSPFFVNDTLIDWPADDTRRRAGVSAFGVGGTNAHVVLEAPPQQPAVARGTDTQLVVLSARSEAALAQARLQLADRLRAGRELDLSAVAFTLQSGRRAHSHRIALTADSIAEAAAILDAAPPAIIANAAPSVAFMFPGQGAQYVNMARGLYDRLPVFRENIDRCTQILEHATGIDLRALLYPSAGGAAAEASLAATAAAQPALFAIGYALAQVWLSWGVVPSAMIGHSVGEFVAATLAGVFTLDDAIAVVAERGRLMQSMPPGAMLAVRLDRAQLAALVSPPLSIAAANSPRLSVAAGPFEAVAALERELSERGVACRRLATSHAFHSAMMDDVLDPLLAVLERVPLRVPRIPYVSGVSGDWITDADATSPAYWARHCRETVEFAAGLRTLVAGGANCLIEAGPGTTLKTFARQTIPDPAICITGSVREAHLERSDHAVMLESLGALWCRGIAPDWRAVGAPAVAARVSLPTYPFERRRHWIDVPALAPVAAPPIAATAPLAVPATPPRSEPHLVQHASVAVSAVPNAADAHASRGADVDEQLRALLEELSGEALTAADFRTTFLELGFDSLFLGRFVQRLMSTFGLSITFRALMTDLPTIATLSAHIVATLPAPEPAAAPAVAPEAVSNANGNVDAFAANATVAHVGPAAVNGHANIGGSSAAAQPAFASIVSEQLAVMQQLMRDQLAALAGISAAPSVNGAMPAPSAAVATPTTLMPVATPAAAAVPAAPHAGVASVASAALSQPAVVAPAQTSAPAPEAPSRFEVFRPNATGPRGEYTEQQRAHIAELIASTTARTARSKAFTAEHRGVLADPRVAAGFRPEWKEMVYPIVCDRAKGSRLWDIDGNEYIDLLNGFGQTALGHSPDFVVEAVTRQLNDGFAIGPQTPLAGQVAQLFCELTGNERVTFCNTGSEAVMAALRIARTVTGRNRVVMFSGAYHGQFDEVLVKAARTSQRALPVAPGIPAESVANMVVLPYADRASLEWVREHAGELAAVVVEPVQSRHPDLQPREFLHEIRAITAASGTAFVMDEVVTGFRIHPGGMQAVFGIRADLATYGKVAGGGMPIGILAGNARFMDALDGGAWQYGDDSSPDVPPTFFAGTFVRHPLTMAAVLAVLRHLKAEGPALQAALSERTAGLVGRLNAELAQRGIVSRIETYGSLFFFNFTGEERLAGLLYYHLRLRGIYIQEGFPCFVTTAHTAGDVDTIVDAFARSLDALQTAGIFGSAPTPSANALAAIAPADVPLTESQTEIWLAAQIGDDASCAFNESITLRLDGDLNERAFAGAWNAVLARHDALRSIFSPTGETLTVAPQAELAYATVDFSDGDAADARARLDMLVATDAATPFDLVTGPPVRGVLARLAPAQHAFVFTAHHIVCDGWSMNVILDEVAKIYGALAGATADGLAQPLAFSTYAVSRDRGDADERARVEAYWLDVYRDPVPALDLPTDRPRSAIRTFRGATRSTSIDAERYRAIKKAGARRGCTLFVTLLSAFGALAGRLAATRDVVIGVPAAGQTLVGDATLVGHCVDFLPIRTRWAAGASLDELLATMKTTVLAAYEHQDYTLGTLVRALGMARETDRVPLAQIQFNLERLGGVLAMPGLVATVAPNPKAFVNFDLFLNAIESENGIRLDCDYNTDLFDAATIDRWLEAFARILWAIVADGTQTVDGLAVTAEPSANPVTASIGVTTGAYPHDASVASLIAAQIALRPHAIAATCGDVSLTYADFGSRVSHVAQRLNARFGTAGGRIGVCLPRSLDMLVALAATQRAGFAYIPLDPTHPSARLRFILGDAGALGVIAGADIDSSILPEGIPVFDPSPAAGAQALAAAHEIAPMPSRDTAAYVIYTSGSTGTPKGVEITHRAVVNFLTSMAREPGFTPDDTLLAVTTVAFDIAGLELYLPLVAGGTVAIARDDEARDGGLLLAALERSGATALQATPATWRMLLETDFRPAPGFKMLCGGEALQRDLADRLLARGGDLWNMYGPTETTIWSSCTRVAAQGPITVGRPIANTSFVIVDAFDRLVAAGATGELLIGGDGLARGYVNRDVLTAEKFIPNPFGSGRLYRTGDTARLLPDGDFVILGRMDDQVKVRGYRIELGEIESTLSAHPALAAVAVVLHADEARLVAYVVPHSGAAVTDADLRTFVQRRLPEYMIPAGWVSLDALPLNPNGKVDRAALVALRTVAEPAFAAPRTPTEAALAAIWGDVLGRERVGADDDIFALGADSIQIFQITARANRKGLPLLAKQLLKHRTVSAVAAVIDATAATAPAMTATRPSLRIARLPVAAGEERRYAQLP